jgi:hypothetical protein
MLILSSHFSQLYKSQLSRQTGSRNLTGQKMLPLNIHSKWEKEVHKGVVIEDYNWSFIYCIPFSVTKDTKLQDLHLHLQTYI